MLEVIAGSSSWPRRTVLPQIRRQARALAVNGSSRSTVLPDVPTLREGHQRCEYPVWFANSCRPDTFGNRDEIPSRNAERTSTPKAREKLAALGVDPMVMSPAEFAAYVEKEIVPAPRCPPGGPEARIVWRISHSFDDSAVYERDGC
jgi:tripartite-type tricarboxylate transporter receptor subunit TctC